ncbi:MAG: hypothetical protein IKA44_07215, partial [Clostridia bacterium]|nr:hypothetical protein [Clostridia bacterium]
MKPNKILAILLTVAMLATSLCLPAFAVDNGGEEVATVANDGATEITNAEQFLAMAADGNYVLAADITLTASYAAAFSGTLDGADHTVTVTNGAVFTSLNGATVKNLNVGSKETPVSLTYAGTEEIKKGVLADYGAGATLENVHLWATVDFTGATGAVRLG